MLNRLTLSPDNPGENVDGTDVSSEEAENRLRKSLEMLSGGAKRETPREIGRETGRETGRELPRDHGRDHTRDHGRDHGRDQGRDHGRDSLDHTAKSAGFTPSGARRHRFKDDGEVPVVHIAPHRDRSQTHGAGPLPPAAPRSPQFVDPHVAEDRAARERAERALEAARETIRQLQTRVGHAELAAREALSQIDGRDRAIAELRARIQQHEDQISVARTVAEHAEDMRRQAAAAAEARSEQHRDTIASLRSELESLRLRLESKPSAPVARVAKVELAPPTDRRKRVVKNIAPVEEEEEPVQWWLTSHPKPKAPGRRAKA